MGYKDRETNSSVQCAEKDGALTIPRPRCVITPKGFVARICKALDTTAFSLAKTLGVPARDVLELLDIPASELVDVDRSIVLTSLAHHVDVRLGSLLAIRDELQAKMNEDIKRRIAQRERFK